MQIDIRPAENSDSAALLHILQVVFAEYPGCVLDIEEVPELLQPATAFAEMGGSLWVAQHQDQVVGCVGLVPDGDPWAHGAEKTLHSARSARSGFGSAFD